MTDRPAVGGTRAAIAALDPLLFSEGRRGNSWKLAFGPLRDQSMYFQLKHPIDLDALRAEFEFGAGIALGAEDRGGWVSFAGLGEAPAFWMQGTTEESWWSRKRRARWWRDWHVAPRPRRPFPNPFAELPS